MLAKGWLLGLRVHEAFEGGRYFEISKVAVAQAMRIRAALAKRGLLAEPGQSHESAVRPLFPIPSSHRLVEACIVEFEGKRPTTATWFLLHELEHDRC